MVKAEDALITLESDKATMDVPSPAAGTVQEVKVKVGDEVAYGTPILLLEAAAAPSPQPLSHDGERQGSLPPRRGRAGERGRGHRTPAAAGAYQGSADLECDMLVLGAGPGGYSAAFRAPISA